MSRYLQYLKISNVNDLKRLASNIYSVQSFMNNKSTFRVGESIYVRIVLHDGYGKRLRQGGDILRIWLKDPAHGSNVNGYVIDHDNGTYTGVVRALWKGMAKVKTTIANTKEHVGIVMSYIDKHGLFHDHAATYKNNKVTERARCSTKPDVYGLKNMCNMTSYNFGLHWYCGRPNSSSLTCDDWTHINGHKTHRLSPIGNQIAR